ncbi:MAG: SDR family oxidoreductase [Bacteroidota bacterium]
MNHVTFSSSSPSGISILGCGWLGLPLGRYLVSRGYKVKGSVTATEKFDLLRDVGIEPYQILLSPSLEGANTDAFFGCETMIINFPPKRRADIEEYHPAQIQALIPGIRNHGVTKVLFVSSTSVYPDLNREVFEHEELTPSKGSGKALKIVEDMLKAEESFETTILRFGGLVGYDRLPGRFLASKKDVPNANAPVNLIHQDDCIEIIYQIIKQGLWGETFNACADEHPLRKDYYHQAALQIGLEPPAFEIGVESSYKIINSEKLKRKLNFTFKYPNPIEMLKYQSKTY